MKHMRRFFSMLLALILLLTDFGVPLQQLTAYAEDFASDISGISGDSQVGDAPDTLLRYGEWLYYLDKNEAVIAGYSNRTVSELAIPFLLDGYNVTGISADAFRDLPRLEKVCIHSQVVHIASNTFQDTGVTIETYSGSYALEYAHQNDIPLINRTDNNEYYELNDSVIDLTGFSHRNYNLVDDTHMTASDSLASNLEAGDVLFFPEGTDECRLAVYQVASVDLEEENSIVWLTAIDELADVLEVMHFHDLELEADFSQIVILDDRVTIEEVNQAKEVGGSVSKSIPLTVGFDMGPSGEHAEGRARIQTKFNFKITGKASIDIDANPLPSIKKASFSIQNWIGYDIEISGNIIGKEQKVNLFKIPVRGGPVTFWFTVTLQVSFSGVVTISGVIQHTLTFTKTSNSDWKIKFTPQTLKPAEVELSAKVIVALPIELSAELGVEIPWLGAIALKFASLKLTPSIEGSGKSKIDVGTLLHCIDVSAVGKLTLTGAVGVLQVTAGKEKWKDIVKLECSGSWVFFNSSFHLDNTAPGIHYQMVDSCRVQNRTVIFDDGSKSTRVTATAGGQLTAPQTPQKAGKTFGGWYYSPSRSGESGSDYKWNFNKFVLPYLNNPSSAYTFYAKWLEPGEIPEPDSDTQPQGTIYGGRRGGFRFYEPPKPIQVTSVTLNKTSEVLHVDGDAKDQLYLTCTVEPYNAADPSVRWSSSNPAVATVDNGVVQAEAPGETTITCTSVMVPSISASCKVTVYSPIYVKSIDLDRSSGELYAGEENKDTLQLNATVNPANATYSSTHWLSSDENVAYVNEKGLVTGLAAGLATITCMSVKNQDVMSSCSVVVHQHVRDVFVSAEKNGLLPGETTRLFAACYPVNSDNKNVIWSTSDPTVATVNENGIVTAKGYGEAVITASAADGAGAMGVYTVCVEHELTLNSSIVNEQLYLDGTSAPIGYVFASQGSVRRMIEKGYSLEWTLKNGDETIAETVLSPISTIYTVDGTDYDMPSVVLNADALHLAGNTAYTVECKAGPYTAEITLPLTIIGEKQANGVTMNTTTFDLLIGEIAHLPNMPLASDDGTLPAGMRVSILGDDYFLSQAYVSEDEDGLSVWFDEPGLYTATALFKAANMVYSVPVTFEVRDENGMMRLPVTSIDVNESSVDMVVGDTFRLEALVSPADAYDQSVTWISDDESIATVSPDGTVTALNPGVVYVTCRSNDGSNLSSAALIHIEPFLALDESVIERTVYLSGNTHSTIGYCGLTYESAKRIDANGMTPDWRLRRISGDATEIGLEQSDSIVEGNLRVDGQAIVMLRVNHEGTDEYELFCAADGHMASCRIVLHVAEGNELPTAVTLAEDSYTVELGETLHINTTAVCEPQGSVLPDETVITLESGQAFWNAQEEDSYFADFSCTFAKPGEYTARVVFQGANYHFEAPIVVRVKDEDGLVPNAVQDLLLSEKSLDLCVGDTAQLNAEVLPADADTGALTWSSYNTAVATVSEDGMVTALDAGLTYILLTAEKTDYTVVCPVTVENGMTLEESTLTRTVFLDGVTRTNLSTVFLTEASSKRLEQAPEWQLQRVSGNNLTLRANGCEVLSASNTPVYGCEIMLYSVSSIGQTVYDLSCKSGNEETTMRVIVNAVNREEHVPANIMLSRTAYDADIDELITIEPEITCWPSGTVLPEGTTVSFDVDKQFINAVNQEDWFVSQTVSTFSFAEAGRYEANMVFTYANISYVIPVVFNIRDSSGNIPVHGKRMNLDTSTLQMMIGDQWSLNAVFTPADVSNRAVTWSSSDESVATVNGSGQIMAVGNGSATITCVPADSHCAPASCQVYVEDYLTVHTGSLNYNCFLEGDPTNSLSTAWLSEGTIWRLERDGIVPEWQLDIVDGSSATVTGSPDEDGVSMRAATTKLNGAGITEYSITCVAGEHEWHQNYTVTVSSLGVMAPKTVSLATPVMNLAVGESATIDFTPVCLPEGSALPAGIQKNYVGIGSFYDAIDRSVYNLSGDSASVAFTEPGRYLLARTYANRNLSYTAVCTIIVGDTDDSYKLLKASEQECAVYIGGKSGAVAQISVTDSMVYERFGDDIKWSLQRLSGESTSAGLQLNGDVAELVITEAIREGRDSWRVFCQFDNVVDYVDINVDVRSSRLPLPESVELINTRFTGTIGDWLYIPLGVKCTPTGSVLPETGDAFWHFEMLGGLASDVSESLVENGLLSICFTESGYYSGNLRYECGNVDYLIPVYFTIMDEENQINVPDEMKVWLLPGSTTVYPEGETGLTIAHAVVAESMNQYYAGVAPSYAEAQGVSWSIHIDSGTAATLSIHEDESNTANIELGSITGTGDVQYTVSCTIGESMYTQSGIVHVAAADEVRPDVSLLHNSYWIAEGETAYLSRMLYRCQDGSVLQSASSSWDPGSAMSSIGYRYESTQDAWKATFFTQGNYTTKVTAYAGNLRFEFPLTIHVYSNEAVPNVILKLPKALTVIEEDAFAGLTVQEIDLRESSVISIGSGAFRSNPDLKAVYIPESVQRISDDAFYGCVNVTIYCAEGSVADHFAAAHGLRVCYETE